MPPFRPIAGRYFFASVAHLDRVTDFESVGSLFESGRTQGVILEETSVAEVPW